MSPHPTAQLDTRFSDPSADPTEWSDALHALEHVELYRLTTVRADGRPHVSQVALTTGNNTWARGLDVVVEGNVVRVTDPDALQRLAGAYDFASIES